MPTVLEEQHNARSNIYKSFKSVIFYNDQYLEEKLFVHLFPSGKGGYNSTFNKWMPLIQYARMRLLAGYTNTYRSDYRYIFFLYDWLIKKMLYSCNHAVNIYKLSEVNKEFLRDVYDQKEISDQDYYEKLGSKTFAKIKHTIEYKWERFYEIQTLMQKLSKPDLFVTVCFNCKDNEITQFINWLYKSKMNEVINFNNHPVEFALFYKKK